MATKDTYAIFWVSPSLKRRQGDQHVSGVPDHPEERPSLIMPDAGIDNNNTQYCQGSTSKNYIQNSGQLAGSYWSLGLTIHTGARL